MNNKLCVFILIAFAYYFFYAMFGYIELSIMFGTLLVAPLLIVNKVINGKKS